MWMSWVSALITQRVTAQDAEEVLEKITSLASRAVHAAETAKIRNGSMRCVWFAANLEKAFYGFEPDFFQHNLPAYRRRCGPRLKGVHRTLADAREICYFQRFGMVFHAAYGPNDAIDNDDSLLARTLLQKRNQVRRSCGFAT